MSDRPTKPAPRPIAPRPVATLVRAVLEKRAQEIALIARTYSGTPAAQRHALEVAHQIRMLAVEIGLPDAANLAADLLSPTESSRP